jgi:hypothetical protein
LQQVSVVHAAVAVHIPPRRGKPVSSRKASWRPVAAL